MKNLLKTGLILFVLFGLTACTGLFDNVGFEDVTFAFRGNENVEGGKLTLRVAGVINDTRVANIETSKDVYTFSFSDVPIGETLQFSADIVMPDGSLLYEGSTSKKIESGKNKVYLDLKKFGGYFLWSGMNSYGVQYKEPDMTYNPYSEGQMYDFAFASNGDVWIGDNSNLYIFPHGEKVPCARGNVDGLTKPDSASFGDLMRAEIIAMNDDNSAFIAGKNRKIKLFNYDGKVTAEMPGSFIVENYTLNEPAEICGDNLPNGAKSVILYNIAVSGNDIYAVYDFLLSPYGTPDDGEFFRIYKGNIDSSSKTINLNPVCMFDSLEQAGKKLASKTFEVTDILVQNDYLYVLVLDRGKNYDGYNNHSRGAILKIDRNGNSIVQGLNENYLDSNDEKLKDLYAVDDSNEKEFFIGPRKIIAIKPKELIIADSGIIVRNKKDPELRKRIVKVDLDTLALKDIKIVNEKLFDGSYNNVCGYSTGN